jgi:hypothetical protein
MSYSNGKFVYRKMWGKWAMTTALAKVVAAIWLCMTLAAVHGDSLRTVGPAVQVVVEAEEAARTVVQTWDKAEAAVKAYLVEVEARMRVVDGAVTTIGTNPYYGTEYANIKVQVPAHQQSHRARAAAQRLLLEAKDRALAEVLTEVATAYRATIWLQGAAEVAIEVTATQTEIATERAMAAAKIQTKRAVECALKAVAAEVVLNQASSVSIIAMKDVAEFVDQLWIMPVYAASLRRGALQQQSQAAYQAVIAEKDATLDVAKDVAVARAMAIMAAESWARALALAAVDARLTVGVEIAEIAVAQPTPSPLMATDEQPMSSAPSVSVGESPVSSVPSVPTEAVESSPSFLVSEDSRSGSML